MSLKKIDVIEPNMNRSSSLLNYENRSIKMTSASGILPGTVEEEFFSGHQSAAGAPLQGLQYSSLPMDSDNNLRLYLKITIIMEDLMSFFQFFNFFY